MSHRPLPRPAQRYVCSAIDCRNGYAGAPAAQAYAEGVYTIDQQVAQLKHFGWRIGIGASSCPACAAAASAQHAQQALATVTRLPVSLESQLRASLREDAARDTNGGSVATLARRYSR